MEKDQERERHQVSLLGKPRRHNSSKQGFPLYVPGWPPISRWRAPAQGEALPRRFQFPWPRLACGLHFFLFSPLPRA